MGEHADAVAELQHEIRARQDVGIAAADLDEDGRLLPRQVEIAKDTPTCPASRAARRNEKRTSCYQLSCSRTNEIPRGRSFVRFGLMTDHCLIPGWFTRDQWQELAPYVDRLAAMPFRYSHHRRRGCAASSQLSDCWLCGLRWRWAKGAEGPT